MNLPQKNNVTIHWHHLKVSPHIESKLHEMVSELRQKFKNLTQVNITIKIDSKVHATLPVAEASVSIAGLKEPIFAKINSSEDLYVSINNLKKNLMQQIIKHKEIIKNHKHHKEQFYNNATKNDDNATENTAT